LKAHEIDEIAGALESYPALGIGKTLQGVVFVNKEKASTGDIEVKGTELDFVGSSPSLKLKFKDIASKSGEQCAVIVNRIDLPANQFTAVIRPECCLQVSTNSGSLIHVCITKSDKYECESEVRKLGSRVR